MADRLQNLAFWFLGISRKQGTSRGLQSLQTEDCKPCKLKKTAIFSPPKKSGFKGESALKKRARLNG
jgi:hypothetical protein